MYSARSCTQPRQSASVIRLGVESSGSFGASTVIGDASFVTRAAGDVSPIGYGIIPGSVISRCPYCTTIVPPCSTHSNNRAFCAASVGSASYARVPITTVVKRERSAAASACASSTVTGMPSSASIGALLSPTPCTYATLTPCGSCASTASIAIVAGRTMICGRMCS
jgi:hypothetical protein